jgi:hypothetical protein
VDNEEARAALHTHLGRWRGRTYEALRALIGQSETASVEGPSGTRYQAQVGLRTQGGGEERVCIRANTAKDPLVGILVDRVAGE